jgi:hypothetical protein
MDFLQQTSNWITPGTPQRMDHKKLCDDLYCTSREETNHARNKKAITT